MSDTPAPRYQVGDEVYGFSFAQAKECQGEIVAINPYTVYGYVLDNGDELGPHDDIGTMESKKRMDEALERFHNEEQNEATDGGRPEIVHMPILSVVGWAPYRPQPDLTKGRVREIVREMMDEDESEPVSRVIQYDGPGSVEIEFEYEGKRYKGTAHEVSK